MEIKVIGVGVDPGNASGAFACIYIDDQHKYSYAAYRFKDKSVPEIAAWVRENISRHHRTARIEAVIEKVHPFEGQGISSSGNLMWNMGIAEGMVALSKIRYHTPAPLTWQHKWFEGIITPTPRYAAKQKDMVNMIEEEKVLYKQKMKRLNSEAKANHKEKLKALLFKLHPELAGVAKKEEIDAYLLAHLALKQMQVI